MVSCSSKIVSITSKSSFTERLYSLPNPYCNPQMVVFKDFQVVVKVLFFVDNPVYVYGDVCVRTCGSGYIAGQTVTQLK